MANTSVPPRHVASYGSDEDGLICAYHFDGGEDTPARAIDAAQAAAWLATRHQAIDGTQGPGEVATAGGEPPPPGSGAAMALRPGAADRPADAFLWLHFNLSNNQAERWLARHAALPDAFAETLQGGLASTRIERVEETLIAVVNDLQFDFAFEPSDTATLWICLDQGLIVTARRKPLRSIDHLRASVRDGVSARSTADLLAQLLRRQADVLVDLVRQTTTRVDEIEDRLLAGRLAHKRLRLGAMRRLLVRLQRLLVPEPAALFRLLQHPPDWMTEPDAQDLREASEEFSMVLRDMVALQERVKLLQEEVAAQVNEDNSRSLFVLTVVTVLALPINIIAGLFGMNVGGIPMAQYEHGFLVVVSIVLAFTVVAGWLALGRRRDE